MAQCECGCGRETNLAPQSRTRQGWKKGEPLRFVLGHGNRKHPHGWDETATGYTTPCWLWRGRKAPGGYPFRGTVSVYREAWEAKYGPVPEGLELDHLCRQPSCVNPDHLEAVTHAENIRRASRTKLTHEQAAAIKNEEGSLRKIAARYGVTHVTILRIKQGRAWA